MARLIGLIQSYVYDARSKVLYWETEGHFVSKGGFDDAESVKHYLGNSVFRLGELALTGARIVHSLSAATKPPPEEIPLVGTTPHYEWP